MTAGAIKLDGVIWTDERANKMLSFLLLAQIISAFGFSASATYIRARTNQQNTQADNSTQLFRNQPLYSTIAMMKLFIATMLALPLLAVATPASQSSAVCTGGAISLCCAELLTVSHLVDHIFRYWVLI